MTYAVKVVKASKAYGSGPPILNNMDMLVQKGTIYGLLGASGCGKTTMLSCIVGIRKLDSGEVTVFGVHPGTPKSGIPGRTIGYMPQDIALYSPFTISECLQYFGRIYGMTSLEINARREFLVNFLDLPEANRRVGSLSGGQQRRVSLAVAMVHQPELLILDEPTVGVDPLIRESIWEYLCDMVSKRGTTVIITTHYIEEARQSNMVGLMRNGRLLTEKPPQTLLEEHNTNLLEDIVLKLCKKDTFGTDNADKDDITKMLAETSFYGVKIRPNKDDTVIETDPAVVGIKYKIRSPDDNTLFWPKKPKLERKKSIHGDVYDGVMSHVEKIAAIFVRNLVLVARNPVLFGCLMLLPSAQVIIFNLIVGESPKHLGLAVVNNEFNQSVDFLEYCSKRESSCFKPGLSCSYLNKFSDKNFNLIPVKSNEEALKQVTTGQAWGYISIPSNFTESMKMRSIERNFVSNETLDGTELKAGMDSTMVIISGFIEASMYANYLGFIQDTVAECGGDPRVADLPLQFNAIYGTLEGESAYKQHISPSQIILIIFLIPMAASITIIFDKRTGTLERTMVAGVNSYHILAGFVLSESLLMLFGLSVSLGVAVIVFKIEIIGSLFLVFLLNIIIGVCGLSVGFLIGLTSDSEIEAVFLMAAIYLPVILSSGATWPLEGNVYWARVLSYIAPCTLPIESFRSIANRGWGLTHSHVWPGFVVPIGWICFLCMITAVFLRVQK